MTMETNIKDSGWKFWRPFVAWVNTTDGTITNLCADVLKPFFVKDLEDNGGLFSSKLNTSSFDESLDDYLCVEVYGLKGSYTPFLAELNQYQIKEVIGENAFKGIFVMLKDICQFIRQNTDKPQAIKNHILSVVRHTENVPVVGKMAQILVFRGVLVMLEGCNIKEDADFYCDFMELHDWVLNNLAQAICMFTYMPCDIAFDVEVMETRIMPFCNYLYYGTDDIGKIANCMALEAVSGSTSTEESESKAPVAESSSKEESAKAGRPKGKGVKPFESCLLGTKQEQEKTMALLTDMLKGKIGRDLALVIRGAMKAGRMTKPSFGQLEQRFGVGGQPSGYNKFMRDEYLISDNEINQVALKFE